jgi:energy-coupling factor transporter ATP-binding protein EcfA2
MIVTKLKLANLRVIEAADFTFKPGFNLIVGVNGVGKSTILDALRICMSRILPSITDSRSKAMSFAVEDIRSGSPFLDVEVTFEIGRHEFRFTRRQWRERFAADDQENLERLRREILNSDRLRDRARNLLRELEESQGVSDSDHFAPPRAELRRATKALRVAPNCVFFSTNRSVVSYAGASRSKTAGGRAVAYAEALVARPWQVGQLADWMRAQHVLGSESKLAARHLEVLRAAASRFLPNYESVRPDSESPSRLVIDHSGATLEVGQLSDGERGILALVLDLARRLSQANPALDDPLQHGEAVVLIDEIDLHLHPKWQRQIVGHLTETFPRCQFIAATHSPQVVAAVEPEQTHLITEAGVLRPDRTLGMDSNWILRHLMEADERPANTALSIRNVEALIKKGAFKKARMAIAEERKKGFDLPEWSVLEARMARLAGLR